MKNNSLLSKREALVITCLSKGMKNIEISKIMGIQERTVGTFIRRVRDKVGIDSSKNIYTLVTHCIKNKYI